MPGPEEITKRLEVAGIDYCIVGGLAAIAYGRPRLTLVEKLGLDREWQAVSTWSDS